MSNPPAWLAWVMGLVITAAGVYISWQQKRLADIRLMHDLYDRRSKIYIAAKTLLVAMQTNAKVSLDDYFIYRRETSDAVFLLDSSVVEYLDKLGKQALEAHRLQERIKGETSDQVEHRRAVNDLATIEKSLMGQFDVLISVFRPSMRLDEHRWKRWFKKPRTSGEVRPKLV